MYSVTDSEPRRVSEVVALFLLGLGVVSLVFYFVLAYAAQAEGEPYISDDQSFQIALGLLGITFVALIMNVLHPVSRSDNWFLITINFIVLASVLGLAAYLASDFSNLQTQADTASGDLGGAIISMIGIAIGACGLGSLIYLVQFVITLAHSPSVKNMGTTGISGTRKTSPKARKSSPKSKKSSPKSKRA